LVRLGLLLLGQLAVDRAERREVAAQRAREQAALEAAHRGRADELVERVPFLRQLLEAVRLERRRARTPVPEPRRLARPLDLLLGTEKCLVEPGRDQALGVERPVVRR